MPIPLTPDGSAAVYTDLITAIKARVDTVSGIGSTHARTRYAVDWSVYLDQFKVTVGGVVQVRGWVVTLDSTNPIVSDSYSFGNTKRTYNCLVIGLMGLSDSSNTEGTFLALTEDVMDALEGQRDLNVATVIDCTVGPPTLRRYEIRQFGSVLCHYCEIALPVEVEKAVGSYV